eukprot:311680_1
MHSSSTYAAAVDHNYIIISIHDLPKHPPYELTSNHHPNQANNPMIQDESTPQKHIMDQYKSFPLLWNPEQNLTPQQLQQLIHANNVQNIKIRFHRAFYILAMSVAFLVFITTFPDHSFAQVAGCGILLMFMMYFGNIVMFLYS